jgi:signal transduction histidine kinase/ActR/RegA family two-component response regulator
MTMPSFKAAPLPFRVLFLLGGFVLLIMVILAAGWFVYLQESNAYWIRHTLEVQKSIARTFSLLQDAETGQRGYLLTGGQDYLDPFSKADAQIEPELEKLASLVTEPAQRQNIVALRSIIDDKRAELRRTIDLRRSGDSEAALSVVREDTGKHLMDRARDLVALMQEAEEAHLSERIDQTRLTSSALQGTIILAASLALVNALMSVYYLRRYLKDIRVAYQELAAANNKLTHEMRERDRLETQLRQSQKMEVIGQLTGGIAHDFNNMLAVVIGNLSLLRRRIANGQTETTRFIDGAIEGANRAAVLTHRLLAFSRQQPLMPAAVDANKLVSAMTELLGRTLGEAVVLETVLAGGLWRIHVDAAQLESALVNLAVNARDAMREGGKLTIETGNTHLDEAYAASHEEVQAGQYVLIATTDTGVGMSPETISKAFEPFFTTKPEGKGTGLGLSQVYGFVKQSGGHVKIYSEVGHGTTIKLYLPRFLGALTESESTSVAAPIPKGDPREIVLVVEDDERVRRVTVDALRDLNYTVLHADGAAKALRLLDGHPDVKLLLTDIVMPEMNGRRLAEEALRRRNDLKVLYFTGFTRNAIVHNDMLDQGVHLMTKPFTLEQLAAKVRELLDLSGADQMRSPQ